MEYNKRKHEIVIALLQNIEHWMSKANSIEEAMDLMGYDRSNCDTIDRHTAFEVSTDWIAHQVNKQAEKIMRDIQ